MNRVPIFTPLFSCILLTTHYCNAFWPLPTKRDIVIAGSAAAGTALILRNYYLGQEERLTETIRTENALTQATVVTQSQAIRATVESAGEHVVAAVEDTHADVRRIAAQTNTILYQNYDIAELLYLLFQYQSQITQAMGLSETITTEQKPHTFSQQRQLPALRSHHSVRLTTLAAKIPCKNFEQLQRIPLQMQIKAQTPENKTICLPLYKITAQGSLEETSFSARLKDISNSLWGKK